MSTLNYLKQKFRLSYDTPQPIVLRGVGRHSQIKELFSELGYLKGAEIGTKDGNYAKELCLALPQLKLYCIDPWQTYSDYKETWSQDQNLMDTVFEKAKQRLSKFNCEIIRKKSHEAVKSFTANSLDFVFIDANHEYDFVLEDITLWTNIVRTNGIIFGHDYTTDHPGVIQAVQDYVNQNKINPWFILRAGGNNVDCWMFVKN